MKIGDKVVCVNDQPCRRCALPFPGLKNGAVYVISDVSPHQDSNGDNGVRVIGVDPHCHPTKNGTGSYMWSKRFRPLWEVQVENIRKKNEKALSY